MITIAIITLLIFLVLGVPVSFAIGLSGLLAIVMGSDVPSFMAVQQNEFVLSDGRSFVYSGRRDSGSRKAFQTYTGFLPGLYLAA